MVISPDVMRPPREAPKFPPAGQVELRHLKEIAAGKEVDIKPVGNLGYVVHNRKASYIAEAPLVLLDWDETGAQTTEDKQRCFKELEGMGISRGIIKFADKFSRVDMGERGDHEVMYEPELEMRLFSQALLDRKDGAVDLTPEVQHDLELVKERMLQSESTDGIPVLPEVQDIYQRTRYTSTLFPDTLDTIRKLKELPGGMNVVLLTYGDPAFQLEKTMQLLEGDDVSQVFLTIAPKGKFFREVIHENPYKDVPLTYKFDSTPRGVGVNFRDWEIPVILFDDDPMQVANFNHIAEKEGLSGLAVVRVRRPGMKYSEREVDTSGFTAEQMHSYLDVKGLQEAMMEVNDRFAEHYLIQAVRYGNPAVLDEPDFVQIVEAIAEGRKTDTSIIRANVLAKARSHAMVLQNDESGNQENGAK